MPAEKMLGQQLVELGLITTEQLEVALGAQKKSKERLGEILLSLHFISETDILRVLAEKLRIHFISSDKLAGVRIAKTVLDQVPMDYAERRLLLPLVFDPLKRSLSVLSNTPTDLRLVKELQILTQCNEVHAYLAMKPTILAGISRFYREDTGAFQRLQEEGFSQQGPLLSFAPVENRQADILGTDSEPRVGGLRLADEVGATSIMSDNLFVETLNILVSLIDMQRKAFRGHSASVARLVKRVSEKLDLLPRDVYFNVVAAYIHDLGHAESPHYTLVNLKTERDLKAAQKLYLSPVRLIEKANFPPIVPKILTHLYERVDGKGFPEGLAGEDIPIGARIVAVVDAYDDLLRQPELAEAGINAVLKELYNYQGTCFDRRVLRAFYEVLSESQRESLPPTGDNAAQVLIIDPLGNAFAPLVARLREASLRILVCRDTDTAVNMLKQHAGKIRLVLSEVSTSPLNGFQLCRALKSNQATKDVHFVFISPREESSRTIQTAFDVGADDFFSRPLRLEVILAKVKRLVETKNNTLTEMQAVPSPTKASVTGNLAEISLPDIVQLLSNSRKTGMLVLRHGEEEAKVFINNGAVINCFHKGKDGEDAFFLLLEWEAGEFALETDVTMPEQKITLSTENLMLEGFRQIDERRAGVASA